MKKRCRNCKHWMAECGRGDGRRPCDLIVPYGRGSAWEREPLACLRDVGVAERGSETNPPKLLLMTRGKFGCRGWERDTVRAQGRRPAPSVEPTQVRHQPGCHGGCGGFFQCSRCHDLVGGCVGADDEWPGWCDECAAKESRMKQERSLAGQKALVQKWAGVPVGTRVFVVKDDGSEVATKTRSEAQLLSGHTAVIWLEGIAGCYLLERVRLCPEEIPHG